MFWTIVYVSVGISALLSLVLFVAIALLSILVGTANASVEENRALQRKNLWLDADCPIIGFFHPFCDAGGGGERVLWTAIAQLQKRYPRALIVIYAWDKVPVLSTLLEGVRATFGIEIDSQNVDVRRLKSWKYLLPETYPHFTLLGQSLGSLYVAWEAMQTMLPDIFIDTVGFAFTYPLARLVFHCKVAAYVHYPTITSTMASRVASQLKSFNNAEFISNSSSLTMAKTLYYRLFTMLYRKAGAEADCIMVNSSWTKGHIDSLWERPSDTKIVYPPSSNNEIEALPLDDKKQKRIILSIGQFRPEKNHELQVAAFKRYVEKYNIKSDASLIMVGGVRNEKDKARVNYIQSLIDDAKLTKPKDAKSNDVYIEIKTNVPYGELVDLLKNSSVGLHTMTDEHFGISVVEYGSAGLIAVAHNSAGPAMDILKPDEKKADKIYGYLAKTEEEFCDAMNDALELSSEESLDIRKRFRTRIKNKFSDDVFAKTFTDQIIALIPKEEAEVEE